MRKVKRNIQYITYGDNCSVAIKRFSAARMLLEALVITAAVLLLLTAVEYLWSFKGLPRTVSPGQFFHLALLGLLAAIMEEWFFRGWLQPIFRKKLPPLAAVTAVNLIFAPLHLIASPYLISLATFFPGMIMGIMKERYDSIWPSVLFHFLGNVWAIWYFPHPF